MATYQRDELGDFSSIVCFKSVITGMEDMLGAQATAIALKAAGRKRGADLCASLGMEKGSGTRADLGALASELDGALGTSGTRLCHVDRIERSDDLIKVYTSETICSAGEEMGSARTCTFTLGAIHGALEYLLGERFRPEHTESVLRGGSHDVFEFQPR